jgi:cellulose synthase (UDP-forming)
LIVAFAMSVYKLYNEPFKADVTLVVAGWNMLNIIIAGCALGVVSERGERQASRRVKISRRCEFGIDGKWYTATINNVSVHGAQLEVYTEGATGIAKDTIGHIRFQPFSDLPVSELPVEIRNFDRTGDVTSVGCRYVPQKALDHRLIADLMFANSAQWTQFQTARRNNPGLLRGTLWFLWLSVYQTSRGLGYLMRDLGKSRSAEKG